MERGLTAVLIGGAISAAADTMLEVYHALDPEASAKFPYNFSVMGVAGDDVVQGVIPVAIWIYGEATGEDIIYELVGSTVYTGYTLLRKILISLVYKYR